MYLGVDLRGITHEDDVGVAAFLLSGGLRETFLFYLQRMSSGKHS